MLHHVSVGLTVKQCVHQIPSISMEASIQPITRTVLRVRLAITPDFRWNDQVNTLGLQPSSRRPCCRESLAGSGLPADPASKSPSVPVQVHGGVGEPWWLWVEDPLNDHIYHSEYFLLQKKQVPADSPVEGQPPHRLEGD